MELPPETFYYYIGSLHQDKEYALSYPVYLTDALDDNDDNDAVPAGIYPTNKSATLHYTNFGPNNEVYLAEKQGVSFTLPADSNIAGVHIALKKIYGTTDTAKVRIFGATDKYSTVEPLSVNTTTDLYYDISNLLGDTIVIYNDTSSVVSITNIKITHTQAPAEGEDRAANRFKVSKQGTAMMLAALESTLPEIQEPEVTPTAPATVVNKWNIVLSDDIGANFYVEAPKDNLANAGNDIAYTAQYPAEYPQLAVNGKISGIRFYGASLVFESKVAVRYYFEAESVEGVAFSVNGVSYPAVEKNGKFYVEVPGIAPSAYADSVVLSVQKDGQQLEVSYSPLTYMVRMSQKGQSELNALMNAMYGYYEAAIAYEQQADQ